jgi:hypothetical protein
MFDQFECAFLVGGAMKCDQDMLKWAHVSCVLWVPEARFGNPDLLEPITDLQKVPVSWQTYLSIEITKLQKARMALRCNVCEKSNVGACIQCSAKCHAAYHVTCAQRNRQEMRIISTYDNTDVNLIVSCIIQLHYLLKLYRATVKNTQSNM